MNRFKNTGTRFNTKNAFIVFLLCFVGIVAKSQEISTIGEVYDFDTGDVFHFEEDATTYQKVSNIEILSKYFSQENDTVFYIRHIYSKESSPEHPDWVYENYVDTVKYFNLDSLVNNGEIDSVYSSEELYNNRLINYQDFLSEEFEYEYSYRFVVGCGQAYYWYYGRDAWNEYELIDSLVYYKKGDEEWGNRWPVAVKETESPSSFITLQPNPATDFVQVKSDNTILIGISIFSINGDLLKTIDLTTGITRINLSGMAPGVYLLQIKTEKQFLFRKLLID